MPTNGMERDWDDPEHTNYDMHYISRGIEIAISTTGPAQFSVLPTPALAD